MKIGTKVKVYGSVFPLEGGGHYRLEGRAGVVVRVDRQGYMEIRLKRKLAEKYANDPFLIGDIHPRQCEVLR